MLPFVSGSFYDFSLDYDSEIINLPACPIEAELLYEGEIPTGKWAKVIVDHDSPSGLTFVTLPEGAGWDEITEVIMVLDQKGWQILLERGFIHRQESYFDCIIRDANYV